MQATLKLMLNSVVVVLLSFILSCTCWATPLQLVGTSGEVSGGEYIGPYFISVAGGVPQSMVCDDLFTSIGIGQVWDATRLGWGDLTDAERPLYGVAYWLTAPILNNPAPHADYQWAVWYLFAPASPLPGGSAALLAWATTQYEANTGWAGYGSLEVWRPNPLRSSQEFLAMKESPEPTTMLYLGSGLFLLSLSRLRRLGFRKANL